MFKTIGICGTGNMGKAMKRWLAICMAIVMMIVLAGCGEVATQKSAPAKETKQEQKADSAATKNTVVAEATGLGNTLDAWTKEYGAPIAHALCAGSRHTA